MRMSCFQMSCETAWERDGDLFRYSKTTVAPRSFKLSINSFSRTPNISLNSKDSTKIQASQRLQYIFLHFNLISMHFHPQKKEETSPEFSTFESLLSEGIHASWRRQAWKSRHLTSPRWFHTLQPNSQFQKNRRPFTLQKSDILDTKCCPVFFFEGPFPKHQNSAANSGSQAFSFWKMQEL